MKTEKIIRFANALKFEAQIINGLTKRVKNNEIGEETYKWMIDVNIEEIKRLIKEYEEEKI